MRIYPDLNKVMRAGRKLTGGIKRAVNWPLWAFLAIFLALLTTCALADQGNEIVKVAQSQIGKGEQGGDNQGPIVEKYTQGKDVAWCAAFVSWTLKQAGKDNRYLLSARSYWEIYRSQRVQHPKPGDIICFYRGKLSGHLGHVGIVEQVEGDQIITIEGNRGNFPSKVARFKYKIGQIHNLLGFVRIQ